MEFVPKSPINDNPVFFQIMIYGRMGEKPLFEPIMAYFTDDLNDNQTSNPIQAIHWIFPESLQFKQMGLKAQ